MTTSDIIYEYNKHLLPETVKIKYSLMSKNIYSFLRGTNHLFYQDLSEFSKLPASPLTWICGDLHMENFGSFKGDNRLIYFDLNDFDEAILAPALFEITRFVTSIFIAFESLKIEEKKAVNMATLFLKTYSETLAKGKGIYIEPKTAKGIVADFLRGVNKRKKRMLLNKRTQKKNNSREIKITPKHLQLNADLKKELLEHISNWVVSNSGKPYNYEAIDVVFRVAGLGSLGLKRYLFLLKSTNTNERYLLVDMKQARPSSARPACGLKKHKQPVWQNEAERVIQVQQRMQNVSPALLSSTNFKGEDYILQEMQSSKDGIELELIKHNYRYIYQVISDMGVLTASSQLRSSGRQGSAICDELMEFGLKENWQAEVIKYARKYTSKIKKDFKEFSNSKPQVKAVKKTATPFLNQEQRSVPARLA